MVNARKLAQRYEKKMTYARKTGGLLAIRVSFFCFYAKKRAHECSNSVFLRINVVSVFSRLSLGHRSVSPVKDKRNKPAQKRVPKHSFRLLVF